MIKRLIYLFLLCAALTALSSCNRPKEISDKDFRTIFKEIYLANAYMQSGVPFNALTDSLDIYRPILEKYGYSESDFRHTIETLSRRKSFRLTKVVDDVIAELESEESNLRYRVSTKDSIEGRAQRMFRRLVYQDSLIVARRVRDTADLHVVIPVEPGEYHVSYSHYLDSTEQNRSLRNLLTLVDTAGRTTNLVTNWMTPLRRQRYTAKLVPKPGDSILRIKFGNYAQKDLKRPGLTIDSLRIYYLPPVEVALDSAYYVWFRYTPNYGVSKQAAAKDSGALHIDFARVSPTGGDNR